MSNNERDSIRLKCPNCKKDFSLSEFFEVKENEAKFNNFLQESIKEKLETSQILLRKQIQDDINTKNIEFLENEKKNIKEKIDFQKQTEILQRENELKEEINNLKKNLEISKTNLKNELRRVTELKEIQEKLDKLYDEKYKNIFEKEKQEFMDDSKKQTHSQLKGLMTELEVKETLESNFVDDQFEKPNSQKGYADLIQIILHNFGEGKHEIGKIYYEVKRRDSGNWDSSEYKKFVDNEYRKNYTKSIFVGIFPESEIQIKNSNLTKIINGFLFDKKNDILIVSFGLLLIATTFLREIIIREFEKNQILNKTNKKKYEPIIEISKFLTPKFISSFKEKFGYLENLDSNFKKIEKQTSDGQKSINELKIILEKDEFVYRKIDEILKNGN